MYWQGWEWCLVLQLLFLLETGIQGQPEHKVTALAGSNVRLLMPHSGKYREVSWFFNTSKKIVLWDSGELTYFDNEMKSRIHLDQSRTLHISRVQKSDSSTYICEVVSNEGKIEQKTIQLQVFGPVPQPVLKQEMIKKVNSNCFLNLSCVVRDPSVSYSWYGESGLLPEFQHGMLELIVNQQNYSDFYTCNVSNPFEWKKATINVSSLCVPGASSVRAWPVHWLVVMLPTVLGLLLM
ncbi:CD48 antigen [Talpa occidentalis]|uniref:CD48 antigen n=1 Tax=Talpa occidentalis TaxID=50954 RepID=UPI00188F2CF1|nr:CD48 antigen [Talpa occidentalis]